MDQDNKNKWRGDGVGKWKLGSDLQPENLDHELDFSASEGVNENENCICGPHSWLQLESPICLQNRITDSHLASSINLSWAFSFSFSFFAFAPGISNLPFCSKATFFVFTLLWQLQVVLCWTAWWLCGLQPSSGSHQLNVIWGSYLLVLLLNPFRAPSSSSSRGCSLVQKKKKKGFQKCLNWFLIRFAPVFVFQGCWWVKYVGCQNLLQPRWYLEMVACEFF